MKAFSKLTALVLVVCLLIGMPLSIDVSAVSGSNSAEFGYRQALLVPDNWGTGLTSGKTFSLYFTGDVNIDLTKTKAMVVGANPGGWSDYYYFNGVKTLSNFAATISQSEEFGERNNYVVTLTGNYTYSQIMDAMASHNTTRAATDQHALFVRLYEVTSEASDGLVDGVTEGGTTLTGNRLCAAGGGKASGSDKYDCYDVAITTTDSAAPLQLEAVDYDATAGALNVHFSQTFTYGGAGRWHTPVYLRVVNAAGEYMFSDGNGNYLSESQVTDGYTVIGSNSTVDFDLEWMGAENQWGNMGKKDLVHILRADSCVPDDTDGVTEKQDFDACVAAAAALNANNTGERYHVALVIEESEDRLNAANGDAANNWRIDNLWNSATKTPLVATHNLATDRAIAYIYTETDQAKNEAHAGTNADLFALTNATYYTNAAGDKFLLQFNKAVNAINTNCYTGLRLYDKTGNLMWNTDGTVGTSGTTPLQWRITDLCFYNTAHTQLAGNLYDHVVKFSGATDYTTVDMIKKYLFTTETVGSLTGLGLNEDDYVLCVSIGDAAGAHGANHKIDGIMSTGGATLFADNSGIQSEERATAAFSKAGTQLKLEKVEVYDEQTYILTFNQPTTITRLNKSGVASDFMGIRITTAGHAIKADLDFNAETADNYAQWDLIMTPYGTDGSQYIGHTYNYKAYSTIEQIMATVNTGSTVYDIQMVFEDVNADSTGLSVGANHVMDSVYATGDPDNKLMATQNNTWGERLAVPVTDTYAAIDCLTLDSALFSDANTATLNFSGAVTTLGSATVSLITETGSYAGTVDAVNGSAVTVSFNGYTSSDWPIGATVSITDGTVDDAAIAIGTQTLFANAKFGYAQTTAAVDTALYKADVNGVYYATLDAALAAASSGATVSLATDITYGDVVMILDAGITLDLNGYQLTVENLLCFGNVIDSSDGVGLIKISGNTTDSHARFQPNNSYMPLYDAASSGYRLFSYQVVNKGTQPGASSDAIKYGVHIRMASQKAYDLLAATGDGNVDISMRITINNKQTLTYTFGAETIKTYGAQASAVFADNAALAKKTLVLTVNGIDDLTAAGMSISVCAGISSPTGVNTFVDIR